MRKLKNKELGRISVEEFKSANKIPVILLLDNIRSIYNVGSIFRTADSFLVNSIYLCGIAATPNQREIHKTALGAEESMNWKYFKETNKAIDELIQMKYITISLEQTERSIPLQNFVFKKKEKYAFIFGNEIKGVQQNIIDKSDYSLVIPQFGTKHSFNITISTAIVLWEYFRKITNNK